MFLEEQEILHLIFVRMLRNSILFLYKIKSLIQMLSVLINTCQLALAKSLCVHINMQKMTLVPELIPLT